MEDLPSLIPIRIRSVEDSPIPLAMSKERPLKKSKDDKTWSVKMTARTAGVRLPDLLRYAPGNTSVIIPFFSSVRVWHFSTEVNRRAASYCSKFNGRLMGDRFHKYR